jgi:hypothetical protein
MTVFLGPFAFLMGPSPGVAAGYCSFLVLQLVLVVRAARHHGEQLVKTVLALKAADR